MLYGGRTEVVYIPVVMAAIECTCLAFLLVIFTAYIVLPRSGNLKRDGFFLCLLSLIAGIASDMISWACECGPCARWLQYSSNTLCLVASGFITSFFSYYIIGLIREKKQVSWLPARIISVVNLCGTIVVLTAAFCGKLFDIMPYPGSPDVMSYEAGGFIYDIPNYLSGLSLLVLFIIVLRNAEVLGRKKIVVFSIYFLMPLFAGALELIADSLQFSYTITGICMSIIYVMLQSSHIDELLLREKLLNEWSYVDSLTGLLNRRAFDREIEEAAGDSIVRIAFCDLNGLKEVNDEKGHQAGDSYLISFSEMLTRHFSHDCVFRISGDEFVVVARGTGDEEFGSRIEGLKRDIDSSSAIASMGTASGPGADVSALIKEAEIKMYEDKENYYMKNPGLKRRRTDFL